jgi:hypothetical protein
VAYDREKQSRQQLKEMEEECQRKLADAETQRQKLLSEI